MKTLVLALTAVLLLGFGYQKQSMDISGNNLFGKNLPDNIFPKLNCPNPPTFVSTVKNEFKKENSKQNGNDIDQSWYQKAMENIEKDEYNISYSEELGAYQSPNRENNIRFIYHKDGFTAKTRDVRGKTQDEWEIKLRITNYE